MSPCRFLVRIARREAGTFEWCIYREDDLVETHRSTCLFETRIEALLDSARAAAQLNECGPSRGPETGLPRPPSPSSEASRSA